MSVKIFSDVKEGGLIWAVECSEGLVRFYDCRCEFTDYGQLVTVYTLDTLLSRPKDIGLMLYGGVSAWQVSGKTMTRITAWLKTQGHVPESL